MPRYKKLRITEYLLTQGNHDAQNAIGLGDKCVGVTVCCASDSPGNINVGWNEPATSKNVLVPGDNRTYGNIEGTVVDGNVLYVGFGGIGARALVSMLNDTGEECS